MKAEIPRDTLPALDPLGLASSLPPTNHRQYPK